MKEGSRSFELGSVAASMRPFAMHMTQAVAIDAREKTRQDISSARVAKGKSHLSRKTL